MISDWWFGTFLFFHLLGITIPAAYHIFQPPTSDELAIVLDNTTWVNIVTSLIDLKTYLMLRSGQTSPTCCCFHVVNCCHLPVDTNWGIRYTPLESRIVHGF